MSPETAAAHIEIQQVIYRQARGVDWGDAAMVAGAYHPDGVEGHGPWTGLGRDYAQTVAARRKEIEAPTQRHVTNILIELRGDEADVESYYIAYPVQVTPEGPVRLFACGRYLDRFEKRDGRWAIARRLSIIDAHRAELPGEPWPGAAAFPAGGQAV